VIKKKERTTYISLLRTRKVIISFPSSCQANQEWDPIAHKADWLI